MKDAKKIGEIAWISIFSHPLWAIVKLVPPAHKFVLFHNLYRLIELLLVFLGRVDEVGVFDVEHAHGGEYGVLEAIVFAVGKYEVKERQDWGILHKDVLGLLEKRHTFCRINF